jgi:RimJ/RimL family protein N-acetyltransferase
MVEGKGVCIYRLIEPDDIKRYFEWLEKEEINYYPYPSAYISGEETERLFSLMSQGGDLFIIKTKKEEPIGYCGIGNIQEKDGNAEIKISICEEEFKKKGWYIDVYITIFRYFFSLFNLHKMYELVYEFEKEKIEALKEMGIKQVGIMPEDFFREGRFWDRYIYNIFAREYYEGLAKRLDKEND